VIPLVEQIVGNGVRVIDPAPAVARQTRRLLETAGTRNGASENGRIRFFTSGEPTPFGSLLPALLGETGEIQKAEWLSDRAVKAS
jgi:glutamate racemase